MVVQAIKNRNAGFQSHKIRSVFTKLSHFCAGGQHRRQFLFADTGCLQYSTVPAPVPDVIQLPHCGIGGIDHSTAGKETVHEFQSGKKRRRLPVPGLFLHMHDFSGIQGRIDLPARRPINILVGKLSLQLSGFLNRTAVHPGQGVSDGFAVPIQGHRAGALCGQRNGFHLTAANPSQSFPHCRRGGLHPILRPLLHMASVTEKLQFPAAGSGNPPVPCQDKSLDTSCSDIQSDHKHRFPPVKHGLSFTAVFRIIVSPAVSEF